MINKCKQKRFILIKYDKEILENQLPKNWLNYEIHYIEEKGYNFIEFNDTKIYNSLFKNNKQSILLEKKNYYIFKVNKKPFLLNDINKILFLNFVDIINIRLNISFIINIFGILFKFQKIMIILTKNNYNCLIEFKNNEKSKNFKEFLVEIKKKFNFDELIVYFSKKNMIKAKKNDFKNNKYYFDKNLKKKENYKFNNIKELSDYLFENIEKFNKETFFSKLYNDKGSNLLEEKSDTSFFFEFLENKINNNKFNFYFQINNFNKNELNELKEIWMKFKDFKIIVNKNYKYNKALLITNSKNYKFLIKNINLFNKKFKIKLLNYKIEKLNNLFVYLFINEINIENLVNFISSNINSIFKQHWFDEFYKKLKKKNYEFESKNNNKIYNLKFIIIKTLDFPKKNLNLIIKNISKKKKIFLIIFNNKTDVLKFVFGLKNKYDFKKLNSKTIKNLNERYSFLSIKLTNILEIF